jgi:uncharacterized repeat protein (TIGR01451 family)
MKLSALLVICFLSLCFLPLQQVSVSWSYLGNKEVKFGISNASNQVPPFFFFDDGHFAIRTNPRHEYHSPGLYEPEVYAATVYNPTLPTKVSSPIPPINLNSANGTGSSTAAQLMNSAVQVGQSWAAVASNKLIYIISFTYPVGGTLPISGTIEFNLDPGIHYHTHYNPAGSPSTYNDWADLGDHTQTGQGDKVSWNFTNLKPNEVRHLYVEVDIPNNRAGTDIRSDVIMYGMNPHNEGTFLVEDHLESAVAGGPRDPNNIEVDYDVIHAMIDQNQQLTYTVNFQNNGNWYAHDVIVEVNLDEVFTLGGNSVQITDSSFPCSLTQVTDNMIEVTFSNIMLPGSNQESPNTFTYDQTTGYVSFTLCTRDQLSSGDVIPADAVIYFDSEPPIATNIAESTSHWDSPGAPYCDAVDTDQDDNDYSSLQQPMLPAPVKQLTAYPNPFIQVLTIPYEVNTLSGSMVKISLIHLSGKEQRTLFEGFQLPGVHQLHYQTDATLPAGVYILEVNDGTHTNSQRLIKVE